MVFLRVRVLQVDSKEIELPGSVLFDPFVAVNVKESVKDASKLKSLILHASKSNLCIATAQGETQKVIFVDRFF